MASFASRRWARLQLPLVLFVVLLLPAWGGHSHKHEIKELKKRDKELKTTLKESTAKEAKDAQEVKKERDQSERMAREVAAVGSGAAHAEEAAAEAEAQARKSQEIAAARAQEIAFFLASLSLGSWLAWLCMQSSQESKLATAALYEPLVQEAVEHRGGHSPTGRPADMVPADDRDVVQKIAELERALAESQLETAAARASEAAARDAEKQAQISLMQARSLSFVQPSKQIRSGAATPSSVSSIIIPASLGVMGAAMASMPTQQAGMYPARTVQPGVVTLAPRVIQTFPPGFRPN